MKIPEFYPKRQGRPVSLETVDLESGQTTLLYSYLALKEEYDKMEETLDRLLSEQIQKVTEMLIELKQIKLHLASMSDEPISEEDIETE